MLEWAGATFVKLTKIRAWQELVFVLAAISEIESREKALNFSYSDGLMTIYEGIVFVVCIFWHICHRHFMIHRATNYVIECFDYFLVCSVINAFITWRSVNKNTNDLKQSPRHFMAQGLLPVKLTHSTHTQSHTHTHTHTHTSICPNCGTGFWARYTTSILGPKL